MFVFRLLAPVFNVDVIVDHPALQRARTIEGGGGDDVGELVGFHPAQQIADAARFELKNAFGLAALQQCVGGFVVERQPLEVEIFAGRLFNQPDRPRKDGEVAEAEEVHLQQARRLDVVHRPLGDDVLFAGDAGQRDVFGDRFVGDDHRGGVGADVAG